MTWRGAISFLPEKHGGEATSMGTPPLRVYWPDARARACWADPPNWRRPGLTLYGDGGTPELALSETPALNGNPDIRQAYLDGMVATYAVRAPAQGEVWDVVRRWRVYAHDRFEDSDAPWVLGELLDVQGMLEAPMTAPPRRRARGRGAACDCAGADGGGDHRVRQTAPGGWRGWLLPDAKSWTASGGTGEA